MIYEYPAISEEIRQGDIFSGMPRVETKLLPEVAVIGPDNKVKAVEWDSVVREGKPVTAVLSVVPVNAIVATHDCDVAHSVKVTLCEIVKMEDVDKGFTNLQSLQAFVKRLKVETIKNLKWFYLPPCPGVGFSSRMAVDFRRSIILPRDDLQALRYLRIGRLNPIAYEHFRERIGNFFRRYAYNEWYSLNYNEANVYAELEELEDADRYAWQRPCHSICGQNKPST